MHAGKTIGLILVIAAAGITGFHIAHHFLYCRYRAVPGKSHCAVCGHRKICRKLHHRP